MAFSAFFGLRIAQVRSLAKWIVIVVPMAAAVGSLVALFLWSLDRATELRFEFPWLIYGTPDPKAGAVHTLYQLLADPRLNHRCQTVSGVLAGPCGEILSRFFQQKRSLGKK